MTIAADNPQHDSAPVDQSENRPPAAWLAELEAHIWAMHPTVLASLVSLARAGTPLETAIERVAPETLRKGRPPAIRGGIAKVNLKGVLMPGGGLMGMLFGLGDPLQEFRKGLQDALASPDVGAVIIEVDSPGGSTDFIPEAAAEVRAAAGGAKPIVAHVNTMAASAAYWIASQADEIVATPSGLAGSIGVFSTHRDASKMYDEMGVKTTLISAGKYKVEANPFEPLSADARAHIQEDVNYFYDLFTADVARGRGVDQQAVVDGYGEGRVLPARAAKSAKLIDRVETLGETVARLSSRSRTPATTSAEADAGADPTVKAEADEAGANEEQAHLLARLEGTGLLQDHAWDKMQPAS